MLVDGVVRWLDDVNDVVGLKSRGGTKNLNDGRWKPSNRGIFLINIDAVTNNRSSARGLGVMIKTLLARLFVQGLSIDPFLLQLKRRKLHGSNGVFSQLWKQVCLVSLMLWIVLQL